ncbi:uncharacterized protein LOC124372273 [Homalodisca vitripennis]|uniref:uncharacterized protein LOC124372273 n=1 Tax=Homalodisca vitripennis TaxID=197043 RepID=UPI001EEAE4FD|nr:uncharacterized protein LOC124372273 [Homalodisca vitripennis]
MFNPTKVYILIKRKGKAYEEQLFGDKIKSKESKNSIKLPLVKSSSEIKKYMKPNRILSQTFVVGRNAIETHKTNQSTSPINSNISKYCQNAETFEAITTNIPKQINKLVDGNGQFKLVENDTDSSKEIKLEKQHRYSFVKNNYSSVCFKESKDFSKYENLTGNQNNLNQSLRSTRHGLVQEPLFRDLESKLSIDKLNPAHNYEKGDSIKIPAQPEDSKGIPQQKHDVLEATYTVETMPGGESNNKEITSPSLSVTKPLLSTVSIQTDWSLVGITVEHFLSEVNIKVPNEVLKLSVSTQTEDLVKQTELSYKNTESLSGKFFKIKNEKSISKNTNSSGDESSNQIIPKNGMPTTVNGTVSDVTMSSEPVTVTLDTPESVKITGEENKVRVNFTKLPENPIVGVEHSKGMTDEIYQNHINQHKDEKDLPARVMEDFHNCLIPCFHPLFEDTVLFELADNATTYQDFMSNKISSKKSPLLSRPHYFGPYNRPSNTNSPKQVLSTTKLKSTRNSSFCKVPGGIQSVERSVLTNGRASIDKYPSGKNKSCDNTKGPKIKNQQLGCITNRDQDQEGNLMNKKGNNGLKYNTTGTFERRACLKDSTASKSTCSLHKTSDIPSCSCKAEDHMYNYLSGLECGDVETNQNYVLPFNLDHYTPSGNHK